MVINIELSATRTELVKYEDAKVYLVEYTKIKKLANGGLSIKSHGIQHHFGVDEWNKIYEAKGDFNVLGIELKKDHPVNGIEYLVEKEKRQHGA